MRRYDPKLEMAVLIALTYLFAKRTDRNQTRRTWMRKSGYILAAELYMR
jgi:hypothetical protein